MLQVDVHFTVTQLQFDAFDAPRFTNTKDLGIQFFVLQTSIIDPSTHYIPGWARLNMEMDQPSQNRALVKTFSWEALPLPF